MTRARLDLVHKCAFCGHDLPGCRGRWPDRDPERHWCGWDIENEAGVFIRYVPDMPENMCKCDRRGWKPENIPTPVMDGLLSKAESMKFWERP